MILVRLLKMNEIRKLRVKIIGVLNVMDFCQSVLIQLKIFIFVGIVMSIVIRVKNGSSIELVMYMWWVYMVMDRVVIVIVVQIRVLYLKIGLWLKIGKIFEMMLKNGRVMMYILG